MGQVIKLSWRSLRRNRQRTAIAVSTIGLGLALVVFFVSLRHGQYSQLVERAVRLRAGHITLERPEARDSSAADAALGGLAKLRGEIGALPGVESTKAVVLGQILIRSAGGAVGAVLVGVDPDAELVSSPLPRRMVAGRYLADGDENVVVVGARLAEQLRVGPGKKVVISTGADGQIVEELARVQGVFSLGAPEVDGYFVQSPLGFARGMFGLGADQATQLGVVLTDPGRAEAATQRIRELAGSAVAVRGWQEIMPDVASYIRIGMAWGLLYQSFLLCLILFSIFTTLVVSVLERKREFAVLLALGTPPRLLRLQVFAETALLGLLGCTLGLALGGACAYAAQVHGIDLRRLLPEGMNLSGYTFDLVVRPRPTLPILLWLGGLDYAAVLALSLYPMRLAGQVRPAEQLR